MKVKSTQSQQFKKRQLREMPLPPLLFPPKSSHEKSWMRQLKREGKVRSIGPRLYTTVNKAKEASVVRSCWSDIVSHLFPNAILSYRSALEYKPDEMGTIYLTSTTKRRVEYPGLALEFIRGPEALEDDPVFRTFRASSFPRALLENLSVTKATTHRAWTENAIEEKLEKELQLKGEGELNAIRDRAREVAEQLGWHRELRRLEAIIGALLGSRPMNQLKSPVARSRSVGRPFDTDCNRKLELLFAELKAHSLARQKDEFKAKDHFRNKAFFEAYFSNYIEGTTFEIEEAEEIVFDGRVPEKRPQDAHDILGTFKIVSDPKEMRRCPADLGEFLSILRARHSILMAERPEVRPGEFKERPNRAGNTRFVPPDCIEGTLEKGIEKYLELPKGLSRAILMMFLVLEVHPFDDGNGRIGRIMMNAELQSEGETTIIVPNVYREDYVRALRALSRRERPAPLIRMLSRAQQFSHMEFSPYKRVLESLQRRNWFEEPDEARMGE